MKAYNIKPQTVRVGDVQITAVVLGEAGRGRKQLYVPCPEGCDLLEPGLTKVDKPRLNRSASADGWVARISTAGAYVRGADGYVSVHPDHVNNVSVIARGMGAFGDAGRTGTWDDLLIAVKGETIIRVKPSRGDAYLLHFTADKVTKVTYAEADLLELDTADSSPTSRGLFERI